MTTHSSKYRSSAVGHVIREHRKARGLTQKQLACELGVEARTLRMYENGERVSLLILQARFIEARTTVDTFFRNLKRQSGNEDPAFLRALAQAHCLAGQVQAITR